MASEASVPPVVLVHGLWLTPRSWEGWKQRCENRGHRVLAPAWPRMHGEVEDLRRDPSALNGLGLTEIVDHYERIVRGLDRPPVIMGHSFGGLVTELLLDRGLGAAGVAISPAPVKGVLRLPPAQLRATFPVLSNPANRKRTVELTPKQFHYNFTNMLAQGEAKAIYDRSPGWSATGTPIPRSAPSCSSARARSSTTCTRSSASSMSAAGRSFATHSRTRPNGPSLASCDQPPLWAARSMTFVTLAGCETSCVSVLRGWATAPRGEPRRGVGACIRCCAALRAGPRWPARRRRASRACR